MNRTYSEKMFISDDVFAYRPALKVTSGRAPVDRSIDQLHVVGIYHFWKP